ncbi:MAG: hypothetical protein AMS25_13515 [Gemmatimonas sp. SM23_52]|nr:MAG: hypothetical protein AMS25_13515 [Gemmatimonas sp. SM23_52]
MFAKKNVGLIVLWIGIVYMALMGWLASWWFAATFRDLTLAEISETAWALNRPLFWLWAYSVPLGSILAGLGLLLRAGSKPSHLWYFGIGMVLALVLIQFLPTGTHHPPVFGVVGGLILAFFLLTVWFWAKNRAHLQGPAKRAADLRLAGYVWLIIAMWYLCGRLGAGYLSAFGELDLGSPVPVILYLALGWLFLFLAQYTEAKPVGASASA